MNTTWIVVADRQRARIFTAEKVRGPLHEVADLVNTAASLREQDLVADRPGRTFDSFGSGRHAMEPPTSPREQEAQRFAGDIMQHLDQAHQRQEFQRLVLCAEPKFLGWLREKLPGRLGSDVVLELAKDLTHLERPEDIREHLPWRF